MNNHKKKMLIIISSIIVIFIIIPITIFVLSNTNKQPTTNTIILDNLSDYSKNINSDVFSSISSQAYSATIKNISNPESVYHGVIRDDSFKNEDNSISFILDIPSIKISWSVGQKVDSSGKPLSDAYIGCISEDEAIYPITTCVDQNSGFMTEEENTLLNITKILPLSGPSYKVTYEISDNKCVLTIKYYTSNGKTDALSAIQKLGYDPSNYTINYIDKS